jgi:hypothetical protein
MAAHVVITTPRPASPNSTTSGDATAQVRGVRAIARELNRDPGTISRELRRNAATRGRNPECRATVAQWKAQTAARRPEPAKLASNSRLREYVTARLSGQLQRPDGSVVDSPPTRWKGLNKPHRADRRWATAWSPEQISQQLVVDFPDDGDMRISHEAIYQALDNEGRGAPKRELVTCLRTGRALRRPRERSRNKPQDTLPQMSCSFSDPPRPTTGRSAGVLGLLRFNHHPPAAVRQVDRVHHAMSGQVEQPARRIPRLARCSRLVVLALEECLSNTHLSAGSRALLRQAHPAQLRRACYGHGH